VDDTASLERIRLEMKARRAAMDVLGIDKSASPEEIKSAWRRACRAVHPDRNPSDRDAPRKFRLANCAYRLLADGIACKELLDEANAPQNPPDHGKYNLDNAWGLFLWWKEKFF